MAISIKDHGGDERGRASATSQADAGFRPAAEPALDDLTELAAYVCNAPMAVVSFVATEDQRPSSWYGVEASETSEDLAFCAHTLSAPGALEISDTSLDRRLSAHPMVIGDAHVRFYAGVPLVTGDGHPLGTVSVMDVMPRSLSAPQRKHLQIVANQVLSHLELRRRTRRFASELDARLAADKALREQQRMLDGVLRYTDVLVYAKDVAGRFVMANRALDHATQIEGGLIGRTDRELFDLEAAEGFRGHDKHIMATREWQVFSEDLVHPDGTVHTYRSTKFPLLDDCGEVIGTGGVSTDVTELAAARAAHAEAEKRWRSLVDRSQAAVIVVDAHGKFTYVNPEAIALCGAASAGQIESQPALNLVPAGGRRAVRSMFSQVLAGGPALRARRGVLRRCDGSEVIVEMNATAFNHSGVSTVQIELRDVSAAVAAQTALIQSASTDPLTGLYNRRVWDTRVESLAADARFRGKPMTIAVIDLDNFKAYNDSHGHTAGDALLQRFAAAAGASLRHEDVFARWGGEEFLIALPDTTPAQAERVLHRVRRSMPSAQTCSIGYTARTPSEALADAVNRADKAMYWAKSLGRDQLSLL